MTIDEIIVHLEREQRRITQALAALKGEPIPIADEPVRCKVQGCESVEFKNAHGLSIHMYRIHGEAGTSNPLRTKKAKQQAQPKPPSKPVQCMDCRETEIFPDKEALMVHRHEMHPLTRSTGRPKANGSATV